MSIISGRQQGSAYGTALSRAAENASQPLRLPVFGTSLFSSNSVTRPPRATAAPKRAVSVPQAPFIGQPCPVCVEPFTIASDVIFCRRKCGQSVHRTCFASMKFKTCPFCGEGMRAPAASQSRLISRPIAMKIERPERTRAARVPAIRKRQQATSVPIPQNAVPMTLDGGGTQRVHRSRNHRNANVRTRDHHFSWASLRQTSPSESKQQHPDDGDIEMKTI